MAENGFFKANKDFLVTETPVDPRVDVAQLLAYLRQERTTGDVVLHLIEGGIRDITMSEKTKASMEQRKRIREILGMR